MYERRRLMFLCQAYLCCLRVKVTSSAGGVVVNKRESAQPSGIVTSNERERSTLHLCASESINIKFIGVNNRMCLLSFPCLGDPFVD